MCTPESEHHYGTRASIEPIVEMVLARAQEETADTWNRSIWNSHSSKGLIRQEVKRSFQLFLECSRSSGTILVPPVCCPSDLVSSKLCELKGN